MKKLQVLLLQLLIIVTLISCHKDTEPASSEPQLSEYNISTLKQLGLIWGFLKYYHPNVAKGDYDWDKELINVMPKVINVKDIEKRDSIIVSWINGLGDITSNNNPTKPIGEVKVLPDLDWIETSDYSEELTSILIKVRDTERSGLNHYVELNSDIKNPVFKNEFIYDNMKYPDTGYRILSLFRYWNILSKWG